MDSFQSHDKLCRSSNIPSCCSFSLCAICLSWSFTVCYTPVEVVFLPLLKLRRRNATYILQIIVISIKNRHVTCFYFFQSVTSITVSFHSHLCVTLSGLSSVSWAKLGACGFFHCGLQPENTVKTTWLQPPSVNQWYCEIFKANGRIWRACIKDDEDVGTTSAFIATSHCECFTGYHRTKYYKEQL